MVEKKRINVAIPKGMRDFGPREMYMRKRVFGTIRNRFERTGAIETDTPSMELKETLTGKYGEDSKKLIFELDDQGGQLLAMRYDLTVPLARYVAMNGLKELKRFQIAKVWRRDNPGPGRYREFYQCDFDWVINSSKRFPDVECLTLMAEILTELDIGPFTIKVNHRQLLDGMMKACGVPEDKVRIISSAIDKLDKNSWDEVRDEMLEKGLDEESADKIGKFVLLKGEPETLLAQLMEMEELQSEQAGSGLAELSEIFSYLKITDMLKYITLDLSLARGLDYYTGVIYEAVSTDPNCSVQSSLAAGGRYDDLIGMFAGERLPAVGLSIGVERIMAILSQKFQGQKISECQISIIYKSNTAINDVFKLATLLRGMGYSADFACSSFNNSKGLRRQLTKADERNVPYVIIYGLAPNGNIILKNMEAKEQTEYDNVDSLVNMLKKVL